MLFPELICSGHHKKIPQTGGLNNKKIYFSKILETRSPSSRFYPIQFLVSAHIMTCRQSPFHNVLCDMASSMCAHEERTLDCSSYRDTSSTPMAPMAPMIFLLQQQPNIRLGMQCVNLRGRTNIQSISLSEGKDTFPKTSLQTEKGKGKTR